MPVSISDHFGINYAAFDATGALDAVLDVDSKLFIDPFLLKGVEAPELQGAYEYIHAWFDDIIRLVGRSKSSGDLFWKTAYRKLSFHEVKGLCIGYSSKGTSGAGMGAKTITALLGIIKQILEAGIDDPTIFELVGMLQEGIGADLISDMTANIILERLLSYSERIYRELDIPTPQTFHVGDRPYHLARNPFTRHSIILVPRDILRDLPIAADWNDIDRVTSANRTLRDRLNISVGSSWKHAVSRDRRSKADLRDMLLRNPDLFREFIATYKAKQPERYNFDADRAGEIAWYRAAKEYTFNFPLTLLLPPNPTLGDVHEIVIAICERFKDLIENNGLSSLLYDENNRPKHESAAQKLFYGIADGYCRMNDLDLTQEANAGRGPLDFKISKGYSRRVVVETKLSTNNQLLHGYETQVGEYQKAEKTDRSVYLVVDVVDGSRSLMARLRRRTELDTQTEGIKPTVIFVDAKPKASASVYKPVPE